MKRTVVTPEDRNVPLREVTAIFGRSRSSILRDIDAGRLPKPFKFGSKLYWRLSELRAVQEAQRAA